MTRTIACAILAASLLVGAAWGHSWYSGFSHPVSGIGCCADEHCKPFPADFVKIVKGGYMVSPPGEEPTLVPFNETLPSADDGYHRCDYGPTPCFFAPDMGS